MHCGCSTPGTSRCFSTQYCKRSTKSTLWQGKRASQRQYKDFSDDSHVRIPQGLPIVAVYHWTIDMPSIEQTRQALYGHKSAGGIATKPTLHVEIGATLQARHGQAGGSSPPVMLQNQLATCSRGKFADGASKGIRRGTLCVSMSKRKQPDCPTYPCAFPYPWHPACPRNKHMQCPYCSALPSN